MADRTDFRLDENTFLVDARYGYQVNQLLQRIRDSFGTSKAQDDKLSKLNSDLRSLYVKLDSTITNARDHIDSLGDMLKVTTAAVVTTE